MSLIVSRAPGLTWAMAAIVPPQPVAPNTYDSLRTAPVDLGTLCAVSHHATLNPITVAADVISELAPPGSPFRRYLIHHLQVHSSNTGKRINWPAFCETLAIALIGLASAVHYRPQFLAAERLKYQEWFRHIVELVRALQTRRVKVINSSSWQQIEAAEIALKGLRATQHLASPEPQAVLQALDDLLVETHQPQLRPTRIESLKSVLRKTVVSNTELTSLKIAVLGYGMNLDVLDFFLRLGFDVTGIEKSGSPRSWLTGKPPYPQDSFHVAAALGIPEWAELPLTWNQFTATEVRAALGNPARLKLIDVATEGWVPASYDWVIAPALADEAHAVAAQLVQPGGYLLVDAFRYPGIRWTLVAKQFIQRAKSAGLFYQAHYEERFHASERALPTDFVGPHNVYLLRRIH